MLPRHRPGWDRPVVGAGMSAWQLRSGPPSRYEDSRLDQCVYELHVWLLASDCRTVIAQHHVAPRSSGRGSPGHWIQVRQGRSQDVTGVREVWVLQARLPDPVLPNTGVTRVPPVRPWGALCPLPAQDQEPHGAWGDTADEGDRLVCVCAAQGVRGCPCASLTHRTCLTFKS